MNEADHPDFLQSNLFPALMVRPDGRILAGNAMAASLLLYPPDELSTLTLWDLISPQQHDHLRQIH